MDISLPTFQWDVTLLLLRVYIAMLFILQGYDKIFKIRVENVSEAIASQFSKFGINKGLTNLLAYYTSYIEFYGGILLLLGVFSPIISLLFLINLTIVSIGFALFTPLWEMKHVFPRVVLLFTYNFISINGDFYSLDTLLKYILRI